MKPELTSAIRTGDAHRVRDLIVAASEKERRAAGAHVKSVHDGLRLTSRGDPDYDAGALARLGTATARQIRSEAWVLNSSGKGEVYASLAADVIAARGRTFAQSVVDAFTRDEFWADWPIVRTLVRSNAVERPDDERYVLTMISGIAGRNGDGSITAVYDALRADPQLLEDELWRVFEVDAGGTLAANNVWELKDPNDRASGYTTKGNRWSYALLELARNGEADRDRLLDASLDALARDFRPSNLAWYAELHEALAPTRTEREARVEKYLSLLATPAPAAMKAGLAGLRALGDAVPADGLARVAPAPLTQKQKNLAVQTLGLLSDAADREPERRDVVLAAVCEGLGHERADVQELALSLLERHAQALPRAVLLGFVDAVSPTVRDRLARLLGVDVGPAEPRAREDGPREVGPPQPLARVESVDELIELSASLLEGQGTGDDVERFLDGVSRFCDRRPRGFDARTAGLLKRAEAPQDWMLGGTGRGLVAYVVQAWVGRRRVVDEQLPHTLLGFVGERALEVARRARRGITRDLLAFPTHQGGAVAPDVLADRERRAGRVLNRPDPFDRIQARLRALTPASPVQFDLGVVERNQYGLPARQLVLRPRSLPGELDALAKVVDPSPATKGVPTWWGVRSGWASWDALGARWSLTVVPSHHELAFAGASMAAGDAIELSPQLHPEGALELALDPRVPLGPEAWLLVAIALVAKSADMRRLATDVLVTTVGDGRFDAGALGSALAWLADNGFAKASRLEQPLRDAGRVSRDHAEQMVRLLEALVTACASTPHGLHAPLGAVLEHAVAARIPVVRREPFERVLAEVSPSSKLARLTRSLLGLQG